MKNRLIALCLVTVGALLATSAMGVRADAPAGHFTDLGDQTIRDNLTGLRWHKGRFSAASYAVAFSLCDSSTLASARWRVPTYLEGASLVDERRRSPALDPVFNVVANDVYLTSTLESGSNYFAVDSQLGYIRPAAGGPALAVRCVGM